MRAATRRSRRGCRGALLDRLAHGQALKPGLGRGFRRWADADGASSWAGLCRYMKRWAEAGQARVRHPDVRQREAGAARGHESGRLSSGGPAAPRCTRSGAPRAVSIVLLCPDISCRGIHRVTAEYARVEVRCFVTGDPSDGATGAANGSMRSARTRGWDTLVRHRRLA